MYMCYQHAVSISHMAVSSVNCEYSTFCVLWLFFFFLMKFDRCSINVDHKKLYSSHIHDKSDGIC